MYTEKFPFYFMNIFIHLAFYFSITILLLKNDYRFSKKKTLLLTLVFIIIYCIIDVVFFETDAPLLKWKLYVPIFSIAITFGYTLLVIKKHYLQLLFLVLVGFSFHANQIALVNIIMQYLPIKPIISWFPEFNNLLLQQGVLLIYVYPMWFLLAKMFYKVTDKGIDFLEWKFTILLPISLLLLNIIFTTTISGKLDNALLELIIQLSLFLVSFVTYVVVLKTLILNDEKHIVEERNAVSNRQIELQKANYDKLSEYMQSSARERHDYRQHFYAIKGLVDSGETAKAREYLNQYVENEKTLEPLTVCQNKAVNGVLSHYITKAKGEGVEVTAQVAINEGLKIDDVELSIVIGNVVENALEACERQKTGSKNIDIKSSVVGGQLLLIVSNSFDGTIVKMNGDFYSSKGTKRIGIGLDSVKKIVQKNGGDIEVGYDEKEFKVQIIMNL